MLILPTVQEKELLLKSFDQNSVVAEKEFCRVKEIRRVDDPVPPFDLCKIMKKF